LWFRCGEVQRHGSSVERLAAILMPLWWSRGHGNEGLRWLDAALERRGSLAPPALAKALFAKATLLLETGARLGQADRLLEESLSLFRALKDHLDGSRPLRARLGDAAGGRDRSGPRAAGTGRRTGPGAD